MLTIELVPRTAHGVNLRSAGSRRQWQIIKALTVARAGHRCEICAAPALERHPLETHEVWDWDEVMAEQRLRRTVALCTWCHRCKHPAVAERLGLAQRVHAHIRRVNEWTQEQLDAHIKDSWRVWLRRSTVQWVLYADIAEITAELQRSTQGCDQTL